MDFKIKTEVTVTEVDVDSLLVSALEGGSRDWATVEKHVDRARDKQAGCVYLSDYILKGSGLVISNGTAEVPGPDFKEMIVDREVVKKALQLMASKEPQHFTNVVTDNADGETGDVLLQLCVLGEVVYG